MYEEYISDNKIYLPTDNKVMVYNKTTKTFIENISFTGMFSTMTGTKDDSKLLICSDLSCSLRRPNGTETITIPDLMTHVSFYDNNNGFVASPWPGSLTYKGKIFYHRFSDNSSGFLQLGSEAGNYSLPRISPDGQVMIVVINCKLFRYTLNSGGDWIFDKN